MNSKYSSIIQTVSTGKVANGSHFFALISAFISLFWFQCLRQSVTTVRAVRIRVIASDAGHFRATLSSSLWHTYQELVGSSDPERELQHRACKEKSEERREKKWGKKEEKRE